MPTEWSKDNGSIVGDSRQFSGTDEVAEQQFRAAFESSRKQPLVIAEPTVVTARHRDYVRSALDIAWHIYAVDRGFDPEHATDDQRADFLVACARAIDFEGLGDNAGPQLRAIKRAVNRAGEHG